MLKSRTCVTHPLMACENKETVTTNNQTINQSLQVQANLVDGTCRADGGEKEKQQEGENPCNIPLPVT